MKFLILFGVLVLSAIISADTVNFRRPQHEIEILRKDLEATHRQAEKELVQLHQEQRDELDKKQIEIDLIADEGVRAIEHDKLLEERTIVQERQEKEVKDFEANRQKELKALH